MCFVLFVLAVAGNKYSWLTNLALSQRWHSIRVRSTYCVEYFIRVYYATLHQAKSLWPWRLEDHASRCSDVESSWSVVPRFLGKFQNLEHSKIWWHSFEGRVFKENLPCGWHPWRVSWCLNQWVTKHCQFTLHSAHLEDNFLHWCVSPRKLVLAKIDQLS